MRNEERIGVKECENGKGSGDILLLRDAMEQSTYFRLGLLEGNI